MWARRCLISDWNPPFSKYKPFPLPLRIEYCKCILFSDGSDTGGTDERQAGECFLFVLLLLFVRLLIQWESLESNVNGNVCGDLHSTHAVQCLVTGCLFPVVACCVCCTFPLIAPQELIRILFAKPHAADFIYLGSRQWHKIHHKRTSYISALNSDISSITEPWLKIQPAVDVHRSKGQRFLMLQSI